MISELELILFDRYYKSEMSEEEVIQIEERFSKDADFKQNYNAYLTSILLIKRSAFKAHLEDTSGRSSSKWSKLTILLIVFFIIIFLSFFIIIGNKNEPQRSEILFAEYFEPLPDMITSRSGRSELTAAMRAFQNAQYEKALILLDTTIYRQDIVKIYRAVAQLGIANVPVEMFEQEISYLPENHPFTGEIKWYLALSFLKSENKESALILLRDINQGGYKYKEAQELIRKLE